MVRWNLSGYALCVGAAAALLAACGGSQPPIGAPGTVPQVPALIARTSSSNYSVVYSFSGGSDGANPYAGLIKVGGTLYGTTFAGGAYYCYQYGHYGCGTVFSVTLSGVETVLHTFGAGTDGEGPRSRLINVRGTLYGTTGGGGTGDGGSGEGYECYYYSPCGTVFSITPSGTEKVLHSFGGSRYHNDGAYPDSGLVDVNGTLYGTTFKGGGGYACITETFACGTVFSITTSGTENLLHSFDGHPDGALPTGDLIHVKSALYGTTDFGGKQHHGYGNGTVFSITPEGTEKVLYRFGAGNDGRKPTSGLIEFKGKLYGTTIIGGTYGSTYSCRYSGYCGTVFSITLGGRETVLHNFGSGADGAGPHASLLVLNGNLYGTTYAGGTYGKGTVFTITPGGAERVLYSFSGANDGGNPRGELIDVNGTLYGTASTGGVHGDGVVFSLTPSL